MLRCRAKARDSALFLQQLRDGSARYGNRAAAFGLAVELRLRRWVKPGDGSSGIIEELHLPAFHVPGGDLLQRRVAAALGGGAVAAGPGRQGHEELARITGRGDGPAAKKIG